MDIKAKIKEAPKYPGCYLWKDQNEQVIYVGMSKYLPQRVASYFNKKHDDKKTRLLVEQIRDVEYQIASSEAEALLMEEELIKIYKPKYNIRGKDDKSRIWSLSLTDEPFPKLVLSRDLGEEPNCINFTSGQLAHEIYNIISDIFPIRNCSYSLTDENIIKEKFKPCLELQLGRCTAPCIGLGKKSDYLKWCMVIKKIFELDFDYAKSWARKEMKYLAKELRFEEANNYLEKTKLIDSLESKLETIRVRRYSKLAWNIKKSLGLKNIPLIIEAFDNSHHGGSANVAASVRFVNNRPEKSEYRKYIIKDEENKGDDCSSFEEVVYRRFKRLLDEKKQLPNLVIIDGGKPQLSAALGVFQELNVQDRIDLISISKDSRHKSKTIHLVSGEQHPIEWMVLAQIQEEIHRFAIEFHRKRASKRLFGN